MIRFADFELSAAEKALRKGSATLALRERAFATALRLPVAWFDRTPVGAVVSRLTNDTEAVKDFYVNVLGVVVANSARVIGMAIAMLLLDWRLAIPCLAFLPAALAVMWAYQRVSGARFRAVRQALPGGLPRIEHHHEIDGALCGCGEPLRRIGFRDPQTGKALVFLTNNFTLPAATICALYKARWQVELFFKWIKQHLRIKAFYGTTENAVKTQIWIAISVYVLVAIVKKTLKIDSSLYTILQILSVTLFEKTPILPAFTDSNSLDSKLMHGNQLTLFN